MGLLAPMLMENVVEQLVRKGRMKESGDLVTYPCLPISCYNALILWEVARGNGIKDRTTGEMTNWLPCIILRAVTISIFKVQRWLVIGYLVGNNTWNNRPRCKVRVFRLSFCRIQQKELNKRTWGIGAMWLRPSLTKCNVVVFNTGNVITLSRNMRWTLDPILIVAVVSCI